MFIIEEILLGYINKQPIQFNGPENQIRNKLRAFRLRQNRKDRRGHVRCCIQRQEQDHQPNGGAQKDSPRERRGGRAEHGHQRNFAAPRAPASQHCLAHGRAHAGEQALSGV